MIRYKLTDAEGNTKGGMHWEVGVTNHAVGMGKHLCTDGWLHVYDTPEQAVFMLPVHVAGYTRLWEVECPEEGITDGTKRGVKSARGLREIPLPEIAIEKRVEIAIRVALLVYRCPGYVTWAQRWLSGEDRSAYAANAVNAANAAGNAAVNAANAAGNAAVNAANAAAHAVDAAAYAAVHAVDAADGPIDLVGIIRDVMGRMR